MTESEARDIVIRYRVDWKMRESLFRELGEQHPATIYMKAFDLYAEILEGEIQLYEMEREKLRH